MTFQLANKLPDTITTDRLVLRAPNMMDAPELQRLANDKHIHEMLARLPHPYTHADAKNFISNLARTKTEHAYAITTKNDTIIGVTGLHLDEAVGLELGYWLGRSYWGHGFATEAAQAIVQTAADCGYVEICARAKSANADSIRILEKSGFVKIFGIVDDCGVHKNVPMSVFKWEQSDG